MPIVRYLFAIWLSVSSAWLYAVSQPPTGIEVPLQMDFCGMHLQFTAAARAQIQGYVNSLTRSPTGYAALVQRGATFLPHVADAFRHMGTPEDLIYIALQESALQGDAVSTSQAVGFWQFKEATARAMGLVVSPQLDERKHLTRSSLAAARYLRQNYDQLGNWFYAVVAYMTGPTGAMPYVKDIYRGAQTLQITENDHWYALKVLAHILAFREAIAQTTPTVWLEAKSVGSERSLWQVLEHERIARITWAPYNLWATEMRLPEGREMTHFLPRTDAVRHAPDPHLGLFVPPPLWVERPAKADTHPQPAPDSASWVRPATEPPVRTVHQGRRELAHEPYYRVAFLFLPTEMTLGELSAREDYPLAKLRQWNPQLPSNRAMPVGTRVLLTPARQVPVHICLPGETLGQVARLYRLREADLLVRNGLSPQAAQLIPGRRLFLRGRRSPEEVPMVYFLPFAPEGN